MADAPVLGGTGKVSLDDQVFGASLNRSLIHESVRAELNAKRQGTAATKSRGEVRGGGATPWRQKGTGRARAGSSRSPIWTGGGTIFGPEPRHYLSKVNRKERRAAMRSALSVHADRGSVAVLDVAAFETPSTKSAAALISAWKADGPVLVVLGADEGQAALSFRNLEDVTVLPAGEAGVADVVRAGRLLASEAALGELGERLGKGGRNSEAAA
ncbi:MAG: 50S ribosomal protein L4 [Solirubrobacterales bacterium]